MSAEELFKDFERQCRLRGIGQPHVYAAISSLLSQCAKAAYQRDPLVISACWQVVRTFGIKNGLFLKYRGDKDARWSLSWFLDTNKPKKSSRERAWKRAHE
jgi:hypothetical protein